MILFSFSYHCYIKASLWQKVSASHTCKFLRGTNGPTPSRPAFCVSSNRYTKHCSCLAPPFYWAKAFEASTNSPLVCSCQGYSHCIALIFPLHSVSLILSSYITIYMFCIFRQIKRQYPAFKITFPKVLLHSFPYSDLLYIIHLSKTFSFP